MKKYVFLILVLILLVVLGLIFRFSFINRNITARNEDILDDKILEVISVDENNSEVIAYLTIEDLEIENAPIADGTDDKTISKYIGHFKDTSYLEGNVCLCSHNRGSKAAFFENLKNAKKEMKIKYITKYETKLYEISEIKEIEETDLSVLKSTKNNQITLITCVSGQKTKRLCVIAKEINYEL